MGPSPIRENEVVLLACRSRESREGIGPLFIELPFKQKKMSGMWRRIDGVTAVWCALNWVGWSMLYAALPLVDKCFRFGTVTL